MQVNPLFQRLALLIGPEALPALEKSRVIVFGLGGVGGWCAEALVRSGIGSISLVDSDRVCASNVNRQIQAAGSTIGRLKTEALETRFLDINPGCEVKFYSEVFSKANADLFDIPGADYVIDAIDTLTFKLDLIEAAAAGGRTFFSSMGMAQKLDPARIRTADVWETHGCPLARLVRQGLRKRDFNGNFTVVYSPERIPPGDGAADLRETDDGGQSGTWSKKRPMGSIVTVTASAGMILASLVIRDICAKHSPPVSGETCNG